MCSPKVTQIIQNRIQTEGLPKLSRRGFLKFGGLTAAAAALSANPRLVGASARRQEMGGGVVDLSHMLSTSFPVFPAFTKAERSALVTVEENGFYAQTWTFGEHTSTHLDAPGHFIGGGALVPQISPDMLVGPAVVIDISAAAADNADAMVTVDDITAWEDANGAIPEGAFVLMYSGWAEVLADRGEEAFSGADSNGGLHFPGFSPEAALFLASERNIKGVGVDTLSLDHGPSATFEAHYNILGAGLLGIENMNNLAMIKDTIATIVLGIPNYEEGSGGPLRVLALT